ncbi:TcfC E-set like domain-containing protein [Endozoicomonas acroporae]|uniref:TcfC E-set like domain-containing protein n=1 Tax=Endozoicomonas acroporae TaxID=1701104 RepID=UPI000C790DF8|nr:TcfC E-set like domain-containing protein [Endozoicomonas acroporae]
MNCLIQQQTRIEQLENEIARLKKLNTRPNLKPNTKPPEDNDQGTPGAGQDENDSDDKPDDSSGDDHKRKVNKPDESTPRQRSQPPCPPVSEEEVIAPEDIPEGSVRHGREPYTVQEMEIKVKTIRYWLEQWLTPEGKTITREDLDFSGGMPVTVFLPTRGRVEVRRDDRLIDSAFFEAGSQQLDTSRFPSGAYDIEIRILDESGNLLSSETRFFAKQSQIPPLDEWLFFMESGRVLDRTSDRTLPEVTDQWLNRAGVSRRLHDTVAATAAMAVSSDDALSEFGLYHFGSLYDIEPSLMLGDNGTTGISVNGRLTLGDLSLSGNFRRVWHDEPRVEPDDGVSLLGNAFEQQAFSAGTPLFDGSLNYRYNMNQSYDDNNSAQDPTRTHSLDYRRTLFRTFDYDADISFSLSKSGDDQIGLVNISFRYRTDHWNFNATPRAEVTRRDGESDSSQRLRLSTSWEDSELLAGDLRFDAGVEGGTGNERINGSVQYANHYGRASFSASHSRSEGNGTTNWGGSMSTSFLTDGEVFALGGEDRSESALVVNLEGRAGDVFDVRVNGQRRGYAVAGSPSIIGLSPYDQYRVTLSPAGETLYSFDEREKVATLYPGNVVTLDYQAIPLQLLFGRLLFNGQPLTDARINGGLLPGSTDDIGMFQLEARSDVGTLQVELGNGWLCPLPVEAMDEGYVLQMGTIDLADAECTTVLEGQLAVSKRGAGELR